MRSSAPTTTRCRPSRDVRLELAQIGNFDGTIGRPLGLVHVYQPWATPVKTSTLAALASTGATPVVDWTCTSDASIISGSQDALITSYADALKAYGRPVFLRWFWEMNLTNLPRTSGCLAGLGPPGTSRPGSTSGPSSRARGRPTWPSCGARRSTGPGSASRTTRVTPTWTGSAGTATTASRTRRCSTPSSCPSTTYWVPHGKPLMIGETGATTDQATYLAQLQAALPVTFPEVKAVLYYDSKSTSDWTLVDTPGNLGMTAFTTLGQTPYFGYPFVGS